MANFDAEALTVFAVVTEATKDGHDAEGFTSTSASAGSASVEKHLMRAYNASLGALVHWYATTVDMTGAEYTGSGTLSQIKWIKRKG